ncbi:MAG: hypothetical protein GY854_17395 [Deltaproteobacteria bacterium]|nr:hypothetical protein [Deltaproteobacteria bacterium]
MLRFFLLIQLFVAVFALMGCGASQEKQESKDICLKRCGLDSMSCLESTSCIDMDGQHVPCEEECEDKRLVCEQAC